jgi:hypothetical protein
MGQDLVRNKTRTNVSESCFQGLTKPASEPDKDP